MRQTPIEWLRQRVFGVVRLDDLTGPERYYVMERCLDLVMDASENYSQRDKAIYKAYMRGVCDTLVGRVQ